VLLDADADLLQTGGCQTAVAGPEPFLHSMTATACRNGGLVRTARQRRPQRGRAPAQPAP